MKKYIKSTLVLIALLAMAQVKAQSTISFSTSASLVYYLYDVPGTETCSDSCEQLVAEQYGFAIKRKASGSVSSGQVRRWNKHNRKVDEALNAKHGMGWRDRYEDDVKACCGK